MQPFNIPVKGLKTGENRFAWHIDKEFFETFGNSEVLAADLDAEVLVLNKDFQIEAYGAVAGDLTVRCDRCLKDLTMPVELEFEDKDFDENIDFLDLGQDIYDFVITSLPIQRIHPEGECDEETFKFLSK